MKVVAIALVLLQASLHSCRSYKAFPKNDTETAKPEKLPSKFIQILESLDSPDAKITKIKELIPVYNDFPEFRVKTNQNHLFMPYKKRGKPLAYILKKAYVNEIVSEHNDENSFGFDDVENNERIYKGIPNSYRNKAYYPTQNEQKPEEHRKNEYSNIPEIHILVDGDDKDELEIDDYDQYNKNKPNAEKYAELIDNLEETAIVLPAEHKFVHHTHRHYIGNPGEKAEFVSNSGKDSGVVTETKHSESNPHHHVRNPKDFQLFQSEAKSNYRNSNREQINQNVTENKPIGLIPNGYKIEKDLDQIQAINFNKHQRHPESDLSIAAVASTDNNHLPDIVPTKHGSHKHYFNEENANPKDDLIHHIGEHHTEDPHRLVKIDADELHSYKIEAVDINETVDANATDQNSGKIKHPHSQSHSSHHHSNHEESVKDFDKYISYLNDFDLASPNNNQENNLNLSNDSVTAILNDTKSVSKENNDQNASDFSRILPGRNEFMEKQLALSNRKLDLHSSDFPTSAYYSDKFDLGKSNDASGSSDHSSEFIDSVLDSNQEPIETFENSSTASSESENTPKYSNELEANDSNSYSESNSAFNSKSIEFDLRLHSSQSESNESAISSLEDLTSEASNLIPESFGLSSESDSTNLSDESYPSQSNDNSVSFESQSSELSSSRYIKSSEIDLSSISESAYSDSVSETDSRSDFSSSSGYLSQSESEQSSQSDLAGANISDVSKESIIQSSENQLNSTVILDPTTLSESNSIGSASDSNSQKMSLEPHPIDINLASEVSHSRLSSANANNSEANTSNPEIVLSTESNSSNVESNAFIIENRARLETTALNSSSAPTVESIDSSLVTGSIVETPVPVLETIVSSLMSSASSLKSVASNLEASALSLSSVPGLECIASKLNTASKLVYDALNLETSALSLDWGSGLSTALNSLASFTESIVTPDLSTKSKAILTSNSESSKVESFPCFESISQLVNKSSSLPPNLKAFYSSIKSSTNNDVHRAEKTDLSKDRPVIENKISNGKKTYSMSFVFNK